ncbi:MAG: hypothetical protein AAFX99_07270, partial [Myxococcota bacterium]
MQRLSDGHASLLFAAVLRWFLLVWTPVALIGCGRTDFGIGSSGERCNSSNDCGLGLLCVAGVCQDDEGLTTDTGISPDMGLPPNDTGLPPNDTGAPPDTNVDTGPCRPGEQLCIDSNTLLVCGDDGNLRDIVCSNMGSVCEDNRCVSESMCDEGERFCDGNAFVICRDGRLETRRCAQNQVCRRGRCVQQEPPDIVPEFGFFEGVLDTLNSEAVVEFSILNASSSNTGPFSCDVYADNGDGRPQPQFDTLLLRFGIEDLPAGEQFLTPVQEVSFGLVVLEQGFYNVYLACDVDNNVAESNENNNTIFMEGGLVVESNPPRELPDLLTFFGAVTPQRFRPGDQLTFEYGVANVGTADTSDVVCEWYLTRAPDNPQPARDRSIQNVQARTMLPVGSEFGDTFQGRVPNGLEPGEYGLYLFCSPFGAPELSLNNNIFIIGSAEVLPDDNQEQFVDLALNFGGMGPVVVVDEGESLTVEVEVCNRGTITSESVQLDQGVYLEPIPEPDLLAYGEQSLMLGALESDDCISVTTEYPEARCVTGMFGDEIQFPL